MNMVARFDRRHPRGVVVIRVLVTAWLLTLTGILLAWGHWGWAVLTIAGAVVHAVWAYRVHRTTRR
jgi:CHASE2 domain-containing sensor protein